jgi:hypothetical protein
LCTPPLIIFPPFSQVSFPFPCSSTF